ncbi:MAG TPA: hypothetical protein VIV57_06925 [Anaeromyxobacter sp.]
MKATSCSPRRRGSAGVESSGGICGSSVRPGSPVVPFPAAGCAGSCACGAGEIPG